MPRTCARGVYRRPLRALMKWVFSALVVLWSLRAIEGPASADLWPDDLFTKITPRKVAKWRPSNPIAVGPKTAEKMLIPGLWRGGFD